MHFAATAILARYKRAIDVVDLEFAARPQPRNIRGLYVDVSQGPGYAKADYGVQCLHGNALVFSYELQSILRADHNMALHGFPVPELSVYKWSQSLLNKLAGDSYFLPNFAGIEAAVFLNRWAPWWNKLERVVRRMSANTDDHEGEGEKREKRPKLNR